MLNDTARFGPHGRQCSAGLLPRVMSLCGDRVGLAGRVRLPAGSAIWCFTRTEMGKPAAAPEGALTLKVKTHAGLFGRT